MTIIRVHGYLKRSLNNQLLSFSQDACYIGYRYHYQLQLCETIVVNPNVLEDQDIERERDLCTYNYIELQPNTRFKSRLKVYSCLREEYKSIQGLRKKS